jgi:N-acetylneuraminate synthase
MSLNALRNGDSSVGPSAIQIGNHWVGSGRPVYFIAEIGINHNGSVETAKRMIDGAVQAGCQAVKFQKRTPEKCVPRDQWDIERDTPWGRMKYIEYRHRTEFSAAQYKEIDAYCRAAGIEWFASCWDEDAVAFMEQFEPPCYKVASASVTDTKLLEALVSTGRPVIMSTGMSTLDQIEGAVRSLRRDRLLLAHAVSLYPCEVSDLNLRMIHTLSSLYPDVPIGYSGHETGSAPTLAAIALGATFIERHITLDRSMWGSDQAASVDLENLVRLTASIREVEKALGDGVKKVLPGELAQAKKLRREAPHASPSANGSTTNGKGANGKNGHANGVSRLER